MSIATGFENKIKYRTKEGQFNLEDFLENYRDNYNIIASKRVFINSFSIKGSPIYEFGEGPREIEIEIDYSPIEERLSHDIYKVKKSQIAKSKFLVDSKQGWFFKQYILTKLD